MSEAAIRFEGVEFRYEDAGFRLEIADLGFARQRTAVIGPSGSGKTTLLHLIAGILVPTAGGVVVLGEPISDLDDRDRRSFRISRLGLVFQEFELLEHLSVGENILLPYLVNPILRPDATVRARIRDLARRAGIEGHLERRPGHLSQGERQRVAVCRALVTGPDLILADEPTGNLDPETSNTILELIDEETRSSAARLIVVTHDHGTLDRFDETVDLGRVGSAAS